MGISSPNDALCAVFLHASGTTVWNYSCAHLCPTKMRIMWPAWLPFNELDY